ncbi:MAG: hypothetical protein DHS20C12_08370 [Pseudohongiella sp.]|nr:MAG: hypothetical protein DHS20C12_08370 [Pseudohongiella sp.]
MDNVKEILSTVRDAMAARLSGLVSEALSDANMVIANEPAGKRSRDLNLLNERDAILERFATNMRAYFDGLTGVVSKDVNVLDYGSLSLVEEDDLEAIIAMEGMISHARNCDISEYLSFTTRLDTLFYGTRIDESNNPMDPEQIGEAFKEAVRPLGMTATELLITYRKFNQGVFHSLEKVLTEANGILIDNDILPNLDMAARSRAEQQNKRSARPQKIDPTDRAFASESSVVAAGGQQQLLSIMQKLMHSIPDAATTGQGQGSALGQASTNVVSSATAQSGVMVGNQKLEVVANDQLLALLNKLQPAEVTEAEGGDSDAGSEPQNLSESVGNLLQQESSADTLRAIDSQSSDIINLVTFLYQEIWNDKTVPIPIKELVGRTQITILKIALNDAGFFDSAEHPARKFLNELATAGISWTGSEKLDQDPVYGKMQDLVTILVRDFADDIAVVEDLLQEFLRFKDDFSRSHKEKEQQLLDEDERKNRLEEIEQYALHKIEERILDPHIDSYAKNFLQTYFHKFVVQVILREGPGGISWRPVMNTIDVLLWTVGTEKLEGDLQRFVKVNPRLLLNLGKALEVAGVESEEAEEALAKLRRVQEACFKNPAGSIQKNAPESSPEDGDESPQHSTATAVESLPSDDEHLQEVSNYPIGIWLEFQAQEEQTIRCTLAAKIDTIEKYVFVNGQGVKVIEKSKMGLARELKAGTVKVICEAPLIDRAMESVIAKLRDAKSEQAA